MQERATKSQEQWNPIEAAIDGDAEERYAAADVHRISRPCEHPGGRERQGWLRRSSVCADVPEDAIGADHHSEAENEDDGAHYHTWQE